MAAPKYPDRYVCNDLNPLPIFNKEQVSELIIETIKLRQNQLDNKEALRAA